MPLVTLWYGRITPCINILAVPGMVNGFFNSSRTDTSIVVTWLEPENRGGMNISKYQVQ